MLHLTERSVRADVLGDHHRRCHIDNAQYLAGREFQKHYEMTKAMPRELTSLTLIERIDFVPKPTDHYNAKAMGERERATQWLNKAHQHLGVDGSRLAYDVLIHAKTIEQIAAHRNQNDQASRRYLARRFYETLDCLALMYGFAR